MGEAISRGTCDLVSWGKKGGITIPGLQSQGTGEGVVTFLGQIWTLGEEKKEPPGLRVAMKKRGRKGGGGV